MNVYNIKDINSLYEKIKIGNEIYKCSLEFSKDYPNFLEWYMKHLIESIITNNRTILYVKDNNNIIAQKNVDYILFFCLHLLYHFPFL